jgi:hypothetical protein
MIYDMDKQTGYTGTHTYWLRQRLEKVGHSALARWMLEQGYNFRYAYFVCFNTFPKEVNRK